MNNLADDIYAEYRAKAADQLNTNENICWPDVVSFMSDGDLGALEESSSQSCMEESITHPDKSCWCGKFVDGKAV
jgi:hypothetical protein